MYFNYRWTIHEWIHNESQNVMNRVFTSDTMFSKSRPSIRRRMKKVSEPLTKVYVYDCRKCRSAEVNATGDQGIARDIYCDWDSWRQVFAYFIMRIKKDSKVLWENWIRAFGAISSRKSASRGVRCYGQFSIGHAVIFLSLKSK